MRTKFPTRGHGPYLLGRRQPGCGGRGALGALLDRQTWRSVAKRSGPSLSRGRICPRLPAGPAADRVLGPGSSAKREPWERRQLLLPPRFPRAPRPNLGQGSSGRGGEAGSGFARRGRPVSSPGGRPRLRRPPFSPAARGRGGSPPPPVAPAIRRGRGLSPAWGSAEADRRKRGRRGQGCQWFLKLAEIPQQLAAAGGSARGSEALASPRLFSPETLTRGFNFVVTAPGIP